MTTVCTCTDTSTGVRANAPAWWQELERAANDQADRFSLAWWECMRDSYLARFPGADATSVENMHSFVEQARQWEASAWLPASLTPTPLSSQRPVQ